MIKDTYEQLMKKYKLPLFDELDAEIHLSSIESELNLLVEIRVKAEEKIDYLLCALHTALHPDPNTLSDLYEYTALSDIERQHALGVYKQLMTVKRALAEAEVISTEKEIAEVITQTYHTIIKTKKQILHVLHLFKKVWQTPVEKQELDRYFG